MSGASLRTGQVAVALLVQLMSLTDLEHVATKLQLLRLLQGERCQSLTLELRLVSREECSGCRLDVGSHPLHEGGRGTRGLDRHNLVLQIEVRLETVVSYTSYPLG